MSNSTKITSNNREVISAVSTLGTGVEPLKSTNGALNVTGAGSGSATVVGIGPVGQNQVAFDTVVYTDTSGTVDTYTYKTGGISGTTTATVTITYVDSTKAQVSTVVRT